MARPRIVDLVAFMRATYSSSVYCLGSCLRMSQVRRDGHANKTLESRRGLAASWSGSRIMFSSAKHLPSHVQDGKNQMQLSNYAPGLPYCTLSLILWYTPKSLNFMTVP